MKLIAHVALCASALLSGCTAGAEFTDSASSARPSSAVIGSSGDPSAPPSADASVDASAEPSAEPSHDTVPLVTGCAIHVADCAMPRSGCYTNYTTGLLVADPTYSTAIIDPHQGSAPVAWRPGFTARQAGPEVEVLDPDGNVEATTGRNYTLPGGYVSEATWVKDDVWPEHTKGMFWTCDTAIAQP